MDFEKLKSFRNINNNFAKLLGIELTELSDGYAKATMKVTTEFLNPIGSLHGGCLYTRLPSKYYEISDVLNFEQAI